MGHDKPYLYSTLHLEEWEQLEESVFNGAGEALQALRQHARDVYAAPLAFLIAAAQRALASLSATTTFDAGVGPGKPNLFTAVVGNPGSGKDETMRRVAEGLTVIDRDREVGPVELPLGSGEGLVSAVAPDPDTGVPSSVLFGASEVGQLESLMRRQGSTLRSTLLQLYSGGPLGTTNKSERIAVEANTYSASVWVGVQPDKAAVLLDPRADDGLRHRFLWTETIDPLRAGATTDPDHPARLHPVLIPDTIIAGHPFTYAPDIVAHVRNERATARTYGTPPGHGGHSTQTRLKLAAGIALLRSSGQVSSDDWKRAGALMIYSDLIVERLLVQLRDRAVDADAERLQRREDADDRVEHQRFQRCLADIRDALRSGEPVRWSSIRHRVNSRRRPVMDAALGELIRAGEVTQSKAEDGGLLLEKRPTPSHPSHTVPPLGHPGTPWDTPGTPKMGHDLHGTGGTPWDGFQETYEIKELTMRRIVNRNNDETTETNALEAGYHYRTEPDGSPYGPYTYGRPGDLSRNAETLDDARARMVEMYLADKEASERHKAEHAAEEAKKVQEREREAALTERADRANDANADAAGWRITRRPDGLDGWSSNGEPNFGWGTLDAAILEQAADAERNRRHRDFKARVRQRLTDEGMTTRAEHTAYGWMTSVLVPAGHPRAPRLGELVDGRVHAFTGRGYADIAEWLDMAEEIPGDYPEWQ